MFLDFVVLVDGKNTKWPQVLTIEAYLKGSDTQTTLSTLTDRALSRSLQPITSLSSALREYRAIFVRTACTLLSDGARRRLSTDEPGLAPAAHVPWPSQCMGHFPLCKELLQPEAHLRAKIAEANADLPNTVAALAGPLVDRCNPSQRAAIARSVQPARPITLIQVRVGDCGTVDGRRHTPR